MQSIKAYIKNGIFFSSLLGIYYLFVFTVYEKIPFPLDVSVLPTVLMALGLLCLLFTTVALFYSSISVIVLTDPAEISYSEIFYAKPNWIKSKHIASFINFLLFFCLTPSILIISSIFEYRWTNELATLSLFVSPLLFSYYSLTPTESVINEKGKCFLSIRYWKTVATFIYIGFFALLSFCNRSDPYKTTCTGCSR